MKITMWVYWWTLINEPQFYLYEIDVNDSWNRDKVFIRCEEFEVGAVEKPSDEFLLGAIVANLNKEKQMLQAETFKKVTEIEEKIQQLLCLDNRS